MAVPNPKERRKERKTIFSLSEVMNTEYSILVYQGVDLLLAQGRLAQRAIFKFCLSGPRDSPLSFSSLGIRRVFSDYALKFEDFTGNAQ